MEHFDWVMGFFIPYTNFIIFAVMLFVFTKASAKQFAQDSYDNFNKAKDSSAAQLENAKKQAEELKKEWAGLEDKLTAQHENQILKTKQYIADLENEATSRLASIGAETTRMQENIERQYQIKLSEKILDKVDSSVQRRFDEDTSGDLATSYSNAQLSNLSEKAS